MVQLRRVARIVNGGTPTSDEANWGGGVAWITPEDLGSLDGDKIQSSKRTLTRDGLASCSATLVPPGSVILSTRAPVGYAAQAEIPVATNQGCRAVVPVPGTYSRFLFYQMLAKRLELQSRANGSTFQELSGANLASLEVELPPAAAQISIADLLDRETGRIDALVEKKRRLIDLLEEKRTALISHVVTKGLDPTVPMKDSGIPWLGKIPAHWGAYRLKHAMSRLIDTEHKTVHFVPDGDYLVIRTSDVRRGQLLPDQARRTDRAGFDEWTRRGVPSPGDVLLSREAPAGEACVVPKNVDLCLGQRMVLIRPESRRLSAEFLVHAIYSEPTKVFIEDVSQGSTVEHLNMGDIPNLPLALPPLEEQLQIAEWLDAKSAKFLGLSERINEQLDLLAEYRQALITAAVTGEIDLSSESMQTANS